MPNAIDAKKFSSLGIAVLPVYYPINGVCTCSLGAACKNTGKHPYVRTAPNGVHDASTDDEAVDRMFEPDVEINIGVACGAISGGLMVQDIDDEEIAELLLSPELGIGDMTLCDTSGRGLHIWLSTSGDTKGRNLIRKDGGPIGELRGDGQYVVAPPSIHRNGKQYSWVNPNTNILLVDDPHEFIVNLLQRIGIELQLTKRYLDRIASDLPDVNTTTLMPLPLPDYLKDDPDLIKLARGPLRRDGKPNRSYDLHYLAHLLVERSRQVKGERMDFQQVAGVVKRIDRDVPGYQKYSDRPDSDKYYFTLGMIAMLTDEDRQRDSMTAGPYMWNRPLSTLSFQRSRSDVAVSSFLPIIEEELTVEVSDEEQATRAYLVSFTQDEQEIKTIIKGEDVDKLKRILSDRLPSDFIVEADGWLHIWPAAQHFSRQSGSIRRRRSYARPGWVEDDGTYSFLLPGVDGAVTAGGIDRTRRFEDDAAPRKLLNYGINVRPSQTPEEVESATSAFLSVLMCGRPAVTVPILLQIMGGPLFSLGLSSSPPLVHVTGETGSYKTSFCTAALNLFGSFSRTQPPESYRSTVNALEERLYYLKDLTLLIDNYVPGQLGAGNLTQLVHSYADGVGRSRLAASGSRRSTPVPRSLWLSTGESIWGENVSVRARTIIVWTSRGDIDKDLLSKLQERAALGELGLVGGTYLAWLAQKGMPQLREMVERGKEAGRRHVEATSIPTIHARPVESMSNLFAIFRIVLTFVKEMLPDAYTTFSAYAATGFSDLLQSVEKDTADASQLSPYNSLLEMLRAALASGAARLGGRGVNDEPVGTMFARTVGWVDDKCVYLNRDVTFGWLLEERRKQGQSIAFNWESFLDEASRRGALNAQLVRMITGDGKSKPVRVTVLKRSDVLDESVVEEEVADVDAETEL